MAHTPTGPDSSPARAPSGGRVSERVVDDLCRYIKEQDLSVGDKLPPERVFMELFGVGRSSLREALRILSAAGIIEVVHGGGMYLASDRTEVRGPAKSLFDATEENALRNLVETRLGIELAAVTALTERGTEADFTSLAQLLDEQDRNLTEDPTKVWAPLAFELAVASLSGNSWLYDVEVLLRDSWVSLSRGLRSSVGHHPEWLAEHRAILASMRSGNVVQAQRMVIAHLSLERFEEDLRRASSRSRSK